MSKYLTLSFIFLIAAEWSSAQIPNGGFEEWESVMNYEAPVGWWTNQDTFNSRFEKDTVSVEGNFSLKIIPANMPPWLDCQSRTAVHVNFNEYLPSNSVLSFYTKVIPIDSSQHTDVYLIFTVFVFDSTSKLNSYSWYTFEPLEEFTKIEIPLMEENINAMTIWIYGGAGSNSFDVCVNRSISWIDGMAIESETLESLSTLLEQTDIAVFPNPTTDYVTIPTGLVFLDLIDIYGLRYRPDSDSSRIYLNNIPAGIYLVRFNDSIESRNYIGRILKPY